MSYIKWFEKHALKHKEIVDRLLQKNYSNEEIVRYFDFENMVKEEIDFCPLYKKNKKCHDMDKLNCYMCACPNFRFNDEGIGFDNEFKILSRCSMNNGEEFSSKGVIHHNCSSCEVPHDESFILKYFSINWSEMMKNCKTRAGIR